MAAATEPRRLHPRHEGSGTADGHSWCSSTPSNSQCGLTGAADGHEAHSTTSCCHHGSTWQWLLAHGSRASPSHAEFSSSPSQAYFSSSWNKGASPSQARTEPSPSWLVSNLNQGYVSKMYTYLNRLNEVINTLLHELHILLVHIYTHLNDMYTKCTRSTQMFIIPICRMKCYMQTAVHLHALTPHAGEELGGAKGLRLIK
jgi:hypothetical protein